MKRKYSCVFTDDLFGFIEFRKAQGYDVHATEQYLGLFDLYCSEFPPDEPVLSQSLIDSWFRHDMNQGCKDLGGRGRAARQFALYLKGMGKEAYVIPTFLFREKSSFAPYIPTSHELSSFFEATDSMTPWVNCDKFAPYIAPVIFRLMYTSGLRPQEACELEDRDVNLLTGEIKIRKNKRKKERIIMVSDDMLRLLNEYVGDRAHIFVRTPFFFPRTDGSHYTSQQLGKLCDKCWAQANPDKSPSELPRLRPYDFRHTFASAVLQKWINEGKDLYVMLPFLRAYMGHEHFEDTAYYIHILPERLISSSGVNWDAIDSVMPEASVWD
ncbi:MAG: integrase [Bacteroidia bacterium]|nr:integrase [Bacteroidia bacterium]